MMHTSVQATPVMHSRCTKVLSCGIFAQIFSTASKASVRISRDDPRCGALMLTESVKAQVKASPRRTVTSAVSRCCSSSTVSQRPCDSAPALALAQTAAQSAELPHSPHYTVTLRRDPRAPAHARSLAIALQVYCRPGAVGCYVSCGHARFR